MASKTNAFFYRAVSGRHHINDRFGFLVRKPVGIAPALKQAVTAGQSALRPPGRLNMAF